MAKFGRRSTENLASCDVRLQKLFNEVVKHYDCSVVCGHRGEAEQNLAFAKGNSKLKFPRSKHNSFPSKAADVAPYYANSEDKIPWNDVSKFILFGGFVLGMAKSMGIDIRWGGDWDHDWEMKDHSFLDYSHFELVD